MIASSKAKWGRLSQTVSPKRLQAKLSPTQEQVCTLARTALRIEDYFGVPCDIERAIDQRGHCWIHQSRPLSIEEKNGVEPEITHDCKLLAQGGATVFPGRAQGSLQQIERLDRLDEVKPGVILLARNAPPQIVSVFGRISGLITEVGHPTGRAATLAREFSLPTIFNLAGALEKLRDAGEIGPDASRRKVYAGLLRIPTFWPGPARPGW